MSSRNQFFYKRKLNLKDGTEYTLHDSFNVNMVVRTYWVNYNTLIVLLNDGHEHPDNKQVPTYGTGKKAGEITGVNVVRTREWVVSEIELDEEDAKRFQELTNLSENAFNNLKHQRENIETETEKETV